MLLGMAIVAVALAVIVPLVRSARQQAREGNCRNNLRQIAIALHNYHDNYRQFPPAYHVDATGKPAHSWRVAIMPFAEKSSFGLDYSFAEPWDGPNNSRMKWSQDNRIFRCPAGNDPPGMTNYVAITGQGTMWPGARSADIADLKDGTSNTIMIVEIAHSDIHWMEPRDLPIEELAEWLDPAHKPRLLAGHIEGGFVAYADGAVEMLSREVAIERLQALATIAGNDNGPAKGVRE
ncbi:MAG: DUF1559 domain-containing protein [Pirellulaceae bacterium]